MSRTNWKYLVDSLMFVCIVGIIAIGLLLAFVLAEGPVRDAGSKYLFGLHRHQWADIHLYLSLAFVFFLIVHLILEWGWIKSRSQQLFSKNWRYALLSFIPLSVGVVAVFWSLALRSAEEYRNYGIGAGPGAQTASAEIHAQVGTTDATGLQGGSDLVTVTGQMTLQDLQKATGIPAEQILAVMNLPGNLDRDQTLGRLRREHAFDMEDLRARLSQLMEERAGEQGVTPAVPESTAGNMPPPAQKPVEHENHQMSTQGRQGTSESAVLITGQMSLNDIQKATGVDARELAQRLRLPAGVSLDERLGRLRRRYGFALTEVREIVSGMMKR